MRTNSKLKRAFVCALSALLVGVGNVPRLEAQATASISGTVTDMSGAAIADAVVQVRNTGTGITQTLASDGQGRFRAPDLAIGVYEVRASKTGFSTVVRAGITVTVGSQPVVESKQIRDLPLNGSAGRITATNSQPRQLQFALKLIF